MSAVSNASIIGIVQDKGLSATDRITDVGITQINGSVTFASDNSPNNNANMSVWALTSSGTPIYLGQTNVTASGAWTVNTTVVLPQDVYTLELYNSTSTTTIPSNGQLASTQMVLDFTPPTETLPGAQTDKAPASIVFGTSHGNAITVADVTPAAFEAVTVTFSVSHGALSLSGTIPSSGIASVSGNNTGSLTIIGSTSAINAYINNNLTYTTTSTNTVTGNTDDTLTVQTMDQAGNKVSGTVAIDVYCFMAGTMIATPAGEVAVETLQPGDLVLTADGRVLPVSWLGRQTVSTVFGDKQRVLPIRIKAGAIADNVPSRDLLISPDHAILIDGVLVQAAALINDSSITRENAVPNVFTYYHVEVADHSLILAENTPAETFVDNVDRMRFDNWDEYQALYPEGKAIAELPYPRAKGHRQVPVNLRVHLATRAQIIGAAVEAVA